MNQSEIIVTLIPLDYDLQTFRGLTARQVPVASVNAYLVLPIYRRLIYTAWELSTFSKGSQR